MFDWQLRWLNDMKLIIGLGNPGKEYEETRHNVGFLVVDELAKHLEIEFRAKKSIEGEIAVVPPLPKGGLGGGLPPMRKSSFSNP